MWVALHLSKVGNLDWPVGKRGSTNQGRFPVDRDRPQLLQ